MKRAREAYDAPSMTDPLPPLVQRVAVTPEELPSLDLDLPGGAPREVHRVVGLLVVASGHFRKTWKEDMDMSIARARAMRRDEPKPGETRATGEAVLLEMVDARKCMFCMGSGRWATAPRLLGAPPPPPRPDDPACADCDGTGEHVTVKAKMVSDQQTSLHDVFLPTELRLAPGLIALERIVESIVPTIPDEAFRCHDLRKVAEVSAYRGTQRQQDPTFFGWSFRDTIDLGAKAVDAFLAGKGRVLSADIRAYAWPLLWLRYDRAHRTHVDVVILRDEQGSARRIRSDEGEKPATMPA